MNAIEAFRQYFDREPNGLQKRQAMNYGGLNDPRVVEGVSEQSEAFLQQLERQCGVQFDRSIIVNLVELKYPFTQRSDEYVMKHCFGVELSQQMRRLKVPQQDDLAAMYRAVLRREPDPEGYAYYRALLDDGSMTLGQLCDELYYNRAKDFARRGLTPPENY